MFTGLERRKELPIGSKELGLGDSAIDMTKRLLLNRRLMFATDVPFWRQANGSHLRILSLIQGLAAEGLQVAVWFVGSVSGKERRRLARQVPHVTWFFCETWLDRLAHKYLPHTAGAKSRASAARATSSLEPTSKTLDDPIARFLDRAVVSRFWKRVEAWKPEFVIVEYLSLASLMDRPQGNKRKGIVPCSPSWILDAHDVLSTRHTQALAQSETSWLELDASTELKWAKRFDVVWAIQNSDAQFFEQSESPQVCVVGHPALSEPLEPRDGLNEPCVFGFVGGESRANREALDWLIENVWYRVRALAPTAELWLGGSIGEATERMRQEGIRDQAHLSGIHWFGRFDDPADFYQRIDVALNSVSLISGLKIKSIEALGFGRPLVTRSPGAMGLENFVPPVVLVADDHETFVQMMVAFSRSASFREEAQRAANLAAQRRLTPNQVYRSALESLVKLAQKADTAKYK